MHVTMVQHAVGQGGFFSGTLSSDVGRLRWIYDCGSNQTEPLGREISRVVADGTVDLLFLSHLDSDHISGLDQLLPNVGDVEIVLPYLSDVDRALLICRDLQAGRLTGLFVDFASDPAGWLLGRGAGRVTFVRGRSDDDEGPGDGPDLGEPDVEGGRGEMNYKWSREPTGVSKDGRATVREVSTAASVQPTTSWRNLDWIFSPYSHRASAWIENEFREVLRRAFEHPFSIADVIANVRKAEGRKILRRCYDAIYDDHNLVSMSLYAGPITPIQHGRWIARSPWMVPAAVGWISTGDAHLDRVQRRASFFHHYRHFLSRVGVLVLPHHGAAKNFHSDLVWKLPNLYTCVAAAGRNGYGHPSDDVRQAAQQRGAIFVQASEDPPSFVTEAVFP